MIEHGEYDGERYATSFQTLADAAAHRRACIVDVLPKVQFNAISIIYLNLKYANSSVQHTSCKD